MSYYEWTYEIEARMAVAVDHGDWPTYFALKEELAAMSEIYRRHAKAEN